MGSYGSYLFMIIYVIQKIKGKDNSQDSLNGMRKLPLPW